MIQKPLVLTCGEPASIAPEITAKAWATLQNHRANAFFLIGDADDFGARCDAAGLNVPTIKITEPEEAHGFFSLALPVMHRPLPVASRAAWIDTRNSPYVIETLSTATQLCLDGKASGMVTNPIHKDALYSVGFKHQGHTDFLASLSREFGHEALDVMMLVAQDLRAVPITVHIALKDVPAALTQSAIEIQAQVVDHALKRYFGITAPRIAVTGLNPHAGENGAMGSEEREVIEPAIANLRRLGLNIFGPLSADTAFHAEAREGYDVVLCMYHDQALIPVKTLDFHGGVNVTLGLPFVRTSPDHGTALDLAGKGTARPDSLIAAIKLAAEMVSRK